MIKYVFTLLSVLIAPTYGTYTCPSSDVWPNFTCPKLSPPPPATSVDKLRPGNIAAVMALGDSITAGFAIKDLAIEYRNLVYSAGGQPGAKTLANYLKHYNPNVTGDANGTTVPLDPYGMGLNLAVSGAVIQGVPAQIKKLKNRLSTTYLHVAGKWKLLTLLIGANDACDCHSASHQPAVWEKNLRGVFNELKSSFPKTFVNVVTLFHISGVWANAVRRPKCALIVPTLKECPCLQTKADRTKMDNLIDQMNKITVKLAADFQGDNNFKIVVQPGLDAIEFGGWGEHYLSDLDCFHPSLCCHQGISLALWNNMWTPPIKKSHTLHHKSPPPYICPTGDTFLQ